MIAGLDKEEKNTTNTNDNINKSYTFSQIFIDDCTHSSNIVTDLGVPM